MAYPSACVADQKVVAFVGLVAWCHISVVPSIHSSLAHWSCFPDYLFCAWLDPHITIFFTDTLVVVISPLNVHDTCLLSWSMGLSGMTGVPATISHDISQQEAFSVIISVLAQSSFSTRDPLKYVSSILSSNSYPSWCRSRVPSFSSAVACVVHLWIPALQSEIPGKLLLPMSNPFLFAIRSPLSGNHDACPSTLPMWAWLHSCVPYAITIAGPCEAFSAVRVTLSLAKLHFCSWSSSPSRETSIPIMSGNSSCWFLI